MLGIFAFPEGWCLEYKNSGSNRKLFHREKVGIKLIPIFDASQILWFSAVLRPRKPCEQKGIEIIETELWNMPGTNSVLIAFRWFRIPACRGGDSSLGMMSPSWYRWPGETGVCTGCWKWKGHPFGWLPQVPIGFEPMHKGFADLSLTTWVWHRTRVEDNRF